MILLTLHVFINEIRSCTYNKLRIRLVTIENLDVKTLAVSLNFIKIKLVVKIIEVLNNI